MVVYIEKKEGIGEHGSRFYSTTLEYLYPFEEKLDIDLTSSIKVATLILAIEKNTM